MDLAAAIARFERQPIRYTERQLFYEWCRGLPWQQLTRGKNWQAPLNWPAPIDPARFAAKLKVHMARYGRPRGLLPADMPAQSLVTSSLSSELAGYGLPVVLLCQRPVLATMLQANGLPLEAACPILPLQEPLAPLLAGMLAKSGGRVLFLHDADSSGLRLATELPTRLALPPQVRFNALGVTPAQAQHLGLTMLRETPTTSLPMSLSAKETAWLQKGKVAEPEALPPLQLLRALKRLIEGPSGQRNLRERLARARSIGFMTWPD